MFRETRKVSAVPTDESLDGVLKTTLEKFEFDVPVNEKNKFVEVWIQYQLTLFEPNGNMVAVWPVSGYGKHQLSHSRQDAVQKAAVTRDARSRRSDFHQVCPAASDQGLASGEAT
jgi:hypothetical protein